MSSKSAGTLLIRADAGPEIGTGHVMRCLALAQAWQDEGGNVVFVTAMSTSSIAERLRRENCNVKYLAEQAGGSADAAYLTRIGRTCGAEWIVLDGYRFGSDYQRTIKEAGFKLLFLDDVGADGIYFADIVLNQNIHAAQSMYPDLRSYTRCLLGPRFALLRREFRRPPAPAPEISKRCRVLITMGGSDPGNVAARVLESIRQVPEPLDVIAVVGPANLGLHNFNPASCSTHQIRVVSDPNSMAELMSWANIAVSAAGSTVWELCRVAVPAILISIADNQVPAARELDQRGVSVYLGPAKSIQTEIITSAFVDLLHSPGRRLQMSQMGQELVDGHGAGRVVNALRILPLQIRRATQKDCWLLWQWVNDPQVRAASFQCHEISREEHAAWFARTLKNNGSTIYIAEDSCGTPVGQFRVDSSADKAAVLDISVAPEKRGAGIGAVLIVQATQRIFCDTGLERIYARIKPQNRSSLRAFEKAGFSNFQFTENSIDCYIERGLRRA